MLWILTHELRHPQEHKEFPGKAKPCCKGWWSVVSVDIVCALPTKRPHVTSVIPNRNTCRDRCVSPSLLLHWITWWYMLSLRHARPAQLDALEAVLADQEAEYRRLLLHWEERVKRARGL